MTLATNRERGRWRLLYLRDWRRARFLSQEELAHKAGVSRPTLVRAERGDLIYGASVRRIAAALHVQPERLLEPPTTCM